MLSRHGQPARALVTVLGIMGLGLVGQRLAGTSVLDATFYALTLGTISLLVATCSRRRRDPLPVLRGTAEGARAGRWWSPTLGGAFVIYTIYKNVVARGVSVLVLRVARARVALIGAAIVAFAPGLTGRVRTGLASASA